MSIFRIFPHRLSKASVWPSGAGALGEGVQALDAELFAKRGVRPEDLGHTSFPKAEEGETLYMMVGEFKDDSPVDDSLADHHILGR